MGTYAIYLVIDALCVWMMSRYMNLFLDGKRDGKAVFVISAAVYWLAYSAAHLWVDSYKIYFVTCFLGLILLSFSYKEKILRKIFVILGILIFAILIKFAVEKCWVALGNPAEDIRVNIMAILFFSLTEIVLERIWGLKGKEFVPGSYYVCMILLPLFSVVSFLLLAEVVGMFFSPLWLVVGAIVILGLNFFVQHFLNQLITVFNEKWEFRLMEQKIETYENQLAVIRQSNEKVHALRHDMKNHIFLLQEYAKNGKSEELEQYLEEMFQSLTVEKEIVSTGNETIDAILNSLFERAKNAGAVLRFVIKIPREPFCSEFDLNILLSNLLENAIDALKVCEKKDLIFFMELEKGVLYLKIRNSFSGTLVREGDLYQTRKKNKDRHGIGLRNVQQIVNKYEGLIEISQKENMFHTDIVLPIGMEP